MKFEHYWWILLFNDGDQEWRGGENEINKTGAYGKKKLVLSSYVSHFLSCLTFTSIIMKLTECFSATECFIFFSRLIMSKQYFFHLLFRHLLDFLFIVARIISRKAKKRAINRNRRTKSHETIFLVLKWWQCHRDEIHSSY